MACHECKNLMAALAEVGLDPKRVMCSEDPPHTPVCVVASGTGSEGFDQEYVDRMTDKAIEIVVMGGP